MKKVRIPYNELMGKERELLHYYPWKDQSRDSLVDEDDCDCDDGATYDFEDDVDEDGWF